VCSPGLPAEIERALAEPDSEDHEMVRRIVELGRARGTASSPGHPGVGPAQELGRVGCELDQGFRFCRRCRSPRSSARCRGGAVIGA